MKGWQQLKAFMGANLISEHDFFNSRALDHVEIRARAIRHLRASGLTVCETADVIRCDHALVNYWTDDVARAKKVTKNIREYRDRRKYRQLASALEGFYS